MKYLAAIVAATALLAVAAGCGGGGDDSTTGSGSGSGGDAAAADAACAKANQRVAALRTPENEVAVLEYLEATEAAVEELQKEVAALDGSSGLREYANALETSVGLLNEMSNAARSRNPDAVRELSKGLVRLHVGKLAEAAGLKACAEAPGAES